MSTRFPTVREESKCTRCTQSSSKDHRPPPIAYVSVTHRENSFPSHPVEPGLALFGPAPDPRDYRRPFRQQVAGLGLRRGRHRWRETARRAPTRQTGIPPDIASRATRSET
jgi:hypothetical protein